MQGRRALFLPFALSMLLAVQSPVASGTAGRNESGLIASDSARAPVLPERGPSNGIADSLLRAAAAAFAAGETPPQDPRLFWRGEKVLVQITFDVPKAEVVRALSALGGELSAEIGGPYLEAWIPVQRLAALGASRGIVAVRAPTLVNEPTEPSSGQIVTSGSGAYGSEPVGKTNAAAWQATGWSGAGLKVGIIDYFTTSGWSASASAGEVPSAPAGTFCRIGGSACSVWSLGDNHGVAVAETIMDMAPGATLYLAYAQTAADLSAVINYFASQGVKIISRSLTAEFDSAGNGTGALNTVASNAVAAGMAWFNASGNSAAGAYWRGPWRDLDGDGWLEFDSYGDEDLAFYCGFVNGLRWSDWVSSGRTDYDAYIFETPYSSNPEGYGASDQTAGQDPIERPSTSCSSDYDIDYLRVGLWAAGSGTSGDTLEFMTNTAGFDHYQSAYSAGAPIVDSSTLGVMAVGAIDPWNGTTIAPYSSRGPTNDGRMKPELSAASNFSSFIEGSFNGTSAATPVVAGAAALVLQAYPNATPASLMNWLRSSAVVDRGTAGPDNTYGAGELYLPSPPGSVLSSPTVTVTKAGTGSGTVASSPAGISCGSTCSAVFPGLSSVTLTATPAAGSTFVGWSGEGCSGTSTCTVAMTAARGVVATFASTGQVLTVSKSGTGAGTVTSSPAGISCGATCSATFPGGTSVTLAASPTSGSVFSGWSGACAGTGTCSVSMTTSRNVTATFTAVSALTVARTSLNSATGTVTSSPVAISCGSTCSALFATGGTVTLTATPASGSGLYGWSANCTPINATSCTVSMDASKTVTATFQAVRTLAVTKTGLGTVVSNIGGISCGATCSAPYWYGTSVTLTATPASGYRLSSWTNCPSISTDTCTASMTTNRTITANFAQITYALTITKSSVGSGTGTVTSNPTGISCGSTCSRSFAVGTNVTLTATPASGSVFRGWSVNCTPVTATTCTVAMDAAKTVTATFATTRTLTVTKTNGSYGTVTSSPAGINCGSTCAYAYVYGTSVVLTASPVAGRMLTSWTNCPSISGNTCTVSMTTARTVTANFA